MATDLYMYLSFCGDTVELSTYTFSRLIPANDIIPTFRTLSGAWFALTYTSPPGSTIDDIKIKEHNKSTWLLYCMGV